MKPGPELDRRIAEACGAEVRTVDIGRGVVVHAKRLFLGGKEIGTPSWESKTSDGVTAAPDWWQPSTNLNHAFEAAEAVGLFDSYGHCKCLCCSTPYSWMVMSGTHGTPIVSGVLTAEAETPALAICAAIEEVTRNAKPNSSP